MEGFRPRSKQERAEKRDAPSSDARNALMAAIALFNTMTATPISRNEPIPERAHETILEKNVIAPKAVDQARERWFHDTLDKEIRHNDIPRMEAMILKDDIPLDLELRYLEHQFREGGLYLREFTELETKGERLAVILMIVNRVTARLEHGYSAQEGLRAVPDIYRHLPDALGATRKIKGDFSCNSFVYEDAAGEIRQDTAAHCMSEDEAAVSGFSVSKYDDAATRILSAADLGRMKIDRQHLPKLASGEQVYGRPILSVSYDPKNHWKEKQHFSIAMPLTKRVEDFFGMAHASDRFFFFTPPEESRVVIKRDAAGKPEVGASGSSGSGVFAAYGAETRVLGALVEQSTIEERCAHVCYSFGMGNMPVVHEGIAQQSSNAPLTDELGLKIQDAVAALDEAKHRAKRER